MLGTLDRRVNTTSITPNTAAAPIATQRASPPTDVPSMIDRRAHGDVARDVERAMSRG